MTPREQADEILAAETPESLPYAILRAGARWTEAMAAGQSAEARHWTAVVVILRRAARSKAVSDIYRVQR